MDSNSEDSTHNCRSDGKAVLTIMQEEGRKLNQHEDQNQRQNETCPLDLSVKIKQELHEEVDVNAEASVQDTAAQIKQELDDTEDTNRKWWKETRDGDKEEQRYPIVMRMTSDMTSVVSLVENRFIYCEKCNTEYEGECPKHGPRIYIDNAECPHPTVDRQESSHKNKLFYMSGSSKECAPNLSTVENLNKKSKSKRKDVKKGKTMKE